MDLTVQDGTSSFDHGHERWKTMGRWEGPPKEGASLSTLAEDRTRLDDGVGREGAAVAHGGVGVDVGGGVDDG